MATKKIPFRTMLDEPVEIITPSGEEEEDVWALKINDIGEEEFYIKGKTNVYEKIQTFEPECNIENILTRLVNTGDTTILMQRKAEYMDITNMPNNMMDAHRILKEQENNFNELPIEIRKKYDYSFSKYLKDVGTDNWMENMGFNKKEPEELKKEEVNTDE